MVDFTGDIQCVRCGTNLKVLNFDNNGESYRLKRIRWCNKCGELIIIGIFQKKIPIDYSMADSYLIEDPVKK